MKTDTPAPPALSYAYDPATDVMEIEGMRYTGSLFRHFAKGGLALDVPMKIVKREEGVITLQAIAAEEKVAAVLAPVKEELAELKGLLSEVRKMLGVPENSSIINWTGTVLQFRDLLLRSVRACAGVGSPILCQCATALKKYNEAIPPEPEA